MCGGGGRKTGRRTGPRMDWRDESAGFNRRADPADRPPWSRKTKNASARPGSRAKSKGRRRRSGLGRVAYWTLVLGVWGVVALAGLVAYCASQLPPIDHLALPKRPPNIAILADDGSLIATAATPAAR